MHLDSFMEVMDFLFENPGRTHFQCTATPILLEGFLRLNSTFDSYLNMHLNTSLLSVIDLVIYLNMSGLVLDLIECLGMQLFAESCPIIGGRFVTFWFSKSWVFTGSRPYNRSRSLQGWVYPLVCDISFIYFMMAAGNFMSKRLTQWTLEAKFFFSFCHVFP